MKAALIILILLTVSWFYTGYLGWTWIPIGRRAKKGQIRIACVGDSITYGAMIKDWYTRNYPYQLQKLLGERYCVHNYGMSGRTAMDTGDHPYRRELRYKRSRIFEPDIVVLLFGTNDSKPGNWRGREEFQRQYRHLVESYLQMDSHPTVLLMEPPAPHHLDGTTGDTYRFEIRRSKVLEAGEAMQEVAGELGQPCLDLFPLTEGHPEWFVQDGIHPNAEGARHLAEIVAREVQGISLQREEKGGR